MSRRFCETWEFSREGVPHVSPLLRDVGIFKRGGAPCLAGFARRGGFDRVVRGYPLFPPVLTSPNTFG